MRTTLKPFPVELSDFVNIVTWTYAKTMPEWPHEYIVRKRVDVELFEQLVRHIRANGYDSKFYQEIYTFFDEDGKTYWTMGAPLEETTVINRCREEETEWQITWLKLLCNKAKQSQSADC
jgi:hypothetical protein